MADPVAQILEQAQNVSGGAPFGEFFVRGVQSAQQDRQLDQRDVGLAIERENTRIADVSMGFKLRAGRAEQLVKLAEQEQDLNFTQAYQAWIARGAHKKDIPNLMGMVNGTSANHAVVEQFFNRVKGIREVEASELQFKAMMDQVTAYEKKSGEVPRSVKFDSTGASVSFGGGKGTLTATAKDLKAREEAIKSGDPVAVAAYGRSLGEGKLGPRQQEIYRTKLDAIKDASDDIIADLTGGGRLPPTGKILVKITETREKAVEDMLALIEEFFGSIGGENSNDEAPAFDKNDPDKIYE